MKTHVIQLERHDDYLSTKDKISWSKAQRILLVWPDRGRPKIFALDLNLLDRYATQLGARLALVTQSVAITEEAYHQGIPVFESIDQARKNAWRVPREWRKSKINEQTVKRDYQGIKSKQSRLRKRSPISRLVEILAFGLGVCAVVGLFVSFIPSAEIVVESVEETQTLQMNMWANPSISSPNLAGGVPAHVRTFNVSGEVTVPTSGEAQIPTKHATGKVLFASLSDQEVIIPMGTVVIAAGDPVIQYETTQSLILGSGSQAEVEVKALESGFSGNIEAGRINGIEGRVGLFATVKNLEPIGGGSEVLGSTAIQVDFQRARVELLNQLDLAALAEANGQAQDNEMVINESLTNSKILKEKYSVEENQAAEVLNATMEIEYEVWVVNTDEVNWAAASALDANLIQGVYPVENTLKVVFLNQPTMRDQRLAWVIQAERQVHPVLELEKIRQTALGQKVDVTKTQIMQMESIKQVEIRQFPSWWQWVSIIPQRVKVVQK
jgi:hypothetical protein